MNYDSIVGDNKGVSVGKYINVMSDAKIPLTIIDFFKNLKDPESIADLQNFGIGMAALTVTCSVFYIASNDPKATNEQFYLYSLFGLLPVIVGGIIASNLFSGELNESKFMFYGTTLFVFIIAMYMFYRVMNPNTVSLASYLLFGLSGLLFIVGLAIVYRIFVRTILNSRGWSGFFLKFIFLIPCLLVEGLEYLFAELKSAPKMVVVLFILEILIVLAYIYLPRISTSSSDTIVLLNRPVFLSSVTTVGNAKQLFMDLNERENPSKDADTIRQNYSISMWVYVNQHPSTHAAYSKETNIFRYGYPSSRIGHPKVAYFNDRNDQNKSDKVIVYVNADLSGVLLDTQMQAWNHLVISYTDSVVDIYVNGSLEKTVQLEPKSRPIYDTGDILEVGEGDNTLTRGGLHGAICNVVYHKAPLTPFQVMTDYNIRRYMNPPIHS
jgi:hypothetical protein